MGLLKRLVQRFSSAPLDNEGVPEVLSRLDWSHERTCPAYVLRDLRTIDPAAELLYMGDGRWMLGVVRWSWPLVQKAATTLTKIRYTATRIEFGISGAEHRERLRGNAARQAFLRLHIQGFRPIAEYLQPVPDSRIVHDFRLRDYGWRVHPEDRPREIIDHADGTPQLLRRQQIMMDAALTRGVDALRHVEQGRRAFSYRGIA